MKHFHPIDRKRVMESLQRVLESQTFSRSQRLRAFLKFVVETEQLGLARQLKGYTIGIDVFSRNQSFDAGGDPLVRVQAGKLRRLLGQYYADEGKSDPLQISIPLGAYVPIYAWNPVLEPEVATCVPVQGVSMAECQPVCRDRLDLVAIADGSPPDRSAPRPFEHLPDPQRHTRAFAVLPHIIVDANGRVDRRIKPYVNALLFAGRRVLGATLLESGDSVHRPGRSLHQLDFTLSVRAASDCAPLCVSLMHEGSGHVLFTQIREASQTATSRQLATLANQCVAETLPLAGLIYQFARAHGYSTPLMDCLDATYHYRIDNSADAYLDARRRQNQLVHPAKLADFTTDLAALIALADGVLRPELL